MIIPHRYHDLVNSLCSFNFTQSEAFIYSVLCQTGEATGYQLAQVSNLNRSIVYATLDKLAKQGAVLIRDGETKKYLAKPYHLLVSELEQRTKKNLDTLKLAFASIETKLNRDFFFNIEGQEQVFAKARSLVLSCKKYLYLNINFPLEDFREEFAELKRRKCQVLLFTFYKQIETHPFPYAPYYQSLEVDQHPNNRFMLCVDNENAFILNKMHGGNFVALYTENRLMIDIISEHIEHDIIIAKLKTQYTRSDFTKLITGFAFPRSAPTRHTKK